MPVRYIAMGHPFLSKPSAGRVESCREWEFRYTTQGVYLLAGGTFFGSLAQNLLKIA